MAIKSRLLSKLKSTYVTMSMAATSHPQKLHPVYQNLVEARKLCRKGLSERNFVKYGEIYDGILMAIRQVLSGKAGKEAEEIVNLCKELLEHIVLETSKEERFKKEMVFLPYKYSMWDSLESIWRAAYEDKDNCIAYVIPIPYCDRNPDGSDKEWYCERDLFPKDIPVMDWQSVDLKHMHPEVIFIHNPYDNCNSATSVDSAYYSFNLREHTDLLVYVPYFVVGHRWPEQHTDLSVYKHMDFMVVQKEHMQIAPMRFSEIKEGEEPYLEDFLPAEKILALGSPKIDKIYYCEKHLEIPKEWLEYIGGRKVIFYNTSISGILQQGDRFLRKMRYVFGSFQRHREVALIWRPHPLIESSLHSVRPELYEEYRELKELYLKYDIGILDTTPDLEMTMAISDAYLGEPTSSVVSLFGYAGKPVFFTGDYLLWREPGLEERASIQIGAHLIEDNMECSYFLAPYYNRFCRMDWQTGAIESLLDFGPNSDICNYGTFVRDEGKFYFSPGSAKAICIYDEAAGEKKLIPYENPLEGGNFGGILKYDHYLYFLPNRYPAMVRLDERTGDLEYYRECWEKILPTVTGEHLELAGGFAWRKYPNLMYISALQSNFVMTFDLATGEYSWQQVGPEDTDCVAMVEEVYGSGIYWLLPWRKSKIRRWDTNTGKVEVLDESAYPEGYMCQTDWWNYEDQYKFSCVVRLEGYVYLLPCYGNMALRLDMGGKKLEQVDLHLPVGWDERKSNYFRQQSPLASAMFRGDQALPLREEEPPEWALQLAYDNRLLWYDFRTLTYMEQPCRLTEAQVQAWTPKMADSFDRVGKDVPYAVSEQRALRSVSQFIEYVASGSHDREKQRRAWSELANNADGTCGEKIKEEVARRLGLC